MEKYVTTFHFYSLPADMKQKHTLRRIHKMQTKKVAFVSYGYPLGVSSMIINSIRLFARKGYLVDIYVNKEHYDQSPIAFTEPGISVIVFDDSRFSFFFKYYFAKKLDLFFFW